MTRSFFSTRLVSVAALAVVAATGTLALPSAASAKVPCGGCAGGHAAAEGQLIMGAATLGVMAAGAAVAGATHGPYYGGDCYIVRRQAVDEFGDLYVRRVRVCE